MPKQRRVSKRADRNLLLLAVLAALGIVYFYRHWKELADSAIAAEISAGFLGTLGLLRGLAQFLKTSVGAGIAKFLTLLERKAATAILLLGLITMGAILALTYSVVLERAKDERRTFKVVASTATGAPFRRLTLRVRPGAQVAGIVECCRFFAPTDITFTLKTPPNNDHPSPRTFGPWSRERFNTADFAVPDITLIHVVPGPDLLRRLPLPNRPGVPPSAPETQYYLRLVEDGRPSEIRDFRKGIVVTGAEARFLPATLDEEALSLEKQFRRLYRSSIDRDSLGMLSSNVQPLPSRRIEAGSTIYIEVGIVEGGKLLPPLGRRPYAVSAEPVQFAAVDLDA